MAELNITPLLDLAFVLLIIFVITTPMLESSIDVNLPTGQPTEKVEPKSVRTVSVDKDGRIFAGNTPVSISQLNTTLIDWKHGDPNVAVLLRADRDIRYQKLVDVFGALEHAGIEKIGLVNMGEEKPAH